MNKKGVELGKTEAMVRFVMPGTLMDRVEMKHDKYGRMEVTVDLHGFRKYEAERTICNIINVVEPECIVKMIHGYQHGTVIKEYIHNELRNKRIAEMWCEPNNPGVTLLKIA